jgi:exodeoxyribonuclease VII small subunit
VGGDDFGRDFGFEAVHGPRLSVACLTAQRSAAIASTMSDTLPDISTLSFEDALRALEEVVRQLESADTPLDTSIALYERGEALRRHCQARLDAAQARIEKIVAGPDGLAAGTRPFDEADS